MSKLFETYTGKTEHLKGRGRPQSEETKALDEAIESALQTEKPVKLNVDGIENRKRIVSKLRTRGSAKGASIRVQWTADGYPVFSAELLSDKPPKGATSEPIEAAPEAPKPVKRTARKATSKSA